MLEGAKSMYEASKGVADNFAYQIVDPEKVLNDKQKQQAKKLAAVFSFLNRVSTLLITTLIATMGVAYFTGFINTSDPYAYANYGLWFLLAIYVLFRFKDYFTRRSISG